jgi:hypothetical protein
MVLSQHKIPMKSHRYPHRCRALWRTWASPWMRQMRCDWSNHMHLQYITIYIYMANYICVCICIHLHVLYIHTYIHACIRTYVRTYICIYIYIHMYIYIYTYVHMNSGILVMAYQMLSATRWGPLQFWTCHETGVGKHIWKAVVRLSVSSSRPATCQTRA